MGSFSIWHWIVIGVIVLVVFGGKGKISDLMGDVAKGIKSFKQNIKEDEKDASMEAQATPPAGNITGPQAGQASSTTAQPQSGNRPAA